MASARTQILNAMYALVSQMIPANGFNYTWGKIEAWENGAMINSTTPQFNIRFGVEDNDDETNSLGNNEYQNNLPVEIRFGALMSSPSDALNTVDTQRETLKSDMLADIKRAFGNPYKINLPTIYSNVSYDSQIDTGEEEDELDAYTVVGGANFTVIYEEGRGVNEW